MLLAQPKALALLALAACFGTLIVSASPAAIVALTTPSAENAATISLDKRNIADSLRGIKRKISGGGGSSSGGSRNVDSHHGGSSPGSSSGGSSHGGAASPKSSKSPREQLGRGKPEFYEKANYPHEEQQFWRYGTIVGTALKSVDKQNKARVNAAWLDAELTKKGRAPGSVAYDRLRKMPLTQARQHATEMKRVDKAQHKIDLAHDWIKEDAGKDRLHPLDVPIMKDVIRSTQRYGQQRVAEGAKGSKRARYRF